MLRRDAALIVLIALLPSIASSAELWLDGVWQLHRSASGDRPAADAQWQPVKVPSFLSQSPGRPCLW